MRKSDGYKTAGLGGLLLLGWLLALTSLQGGSLSVDEADHFDYGRRVLEGRFEFDPARRDTGKMPVSALNVLPARLLDPQSLKSCPNCPQAVETGRHVTLFFSVILGLLVFRWTETLYGSAAGFFALLLYTFSPTILAHRRYVTTDLYAALTFFAAIYSLWSFQRKSGWRRGLRTALLIGIAQIVKYSSIWLFPIIFLIQLITVLRAGSEKRKALRHHALWFGIFILATLAVINITYGFRGSLKPIGQYTFRSPAFQTLQSRLPAGFPVPLPEEWPQRLDHLMYVEATGETYGPVYLFEKFQEVDKKGFRGYYLWAYLLKEPIAAQLLLLLALYCYLKRRKEFNFGENELYLAVPVIFCGIYVNFFLRTQIGIRYALPLFPLLYVFTAGLLKNWPAVSRRFKMILSALLIYLILSVMSYYPFFLAYFNEAVPDRSQAYRYLLDSNLVWGDQWPRMAEYLKQHPGEPVIFNPQTPVKGRVIFDVWSYFLNPSRYQMHWFLDHYRPSGHIGYAYWIYEID